MIVDQLTAPKIQCRCSISAEAGPLAEKDYGLYLSGWALRWHSRNPRGVAELMSNTERGDCSVESYASKDCTGLYWEQSQQKPLARFPYYELQLKKILCNRENPQYHNQWQTDWTLGLSTWVWLLEGLSYILSKPQTFRKYGKIDFLFIKLTYWFLKQHQFIEIKQMWPNVQMGIAIY